MCEAGFALYVILAVVCPSYMQEEEAFSGSSVTMDSSQKIATQQTNH